MLDELVVVRGGGDLGTGTAWRLHHEGFPVIVLEIDRPLAVRRKVAFATAVTDATIAIEGVDGVLAADTDSALRLSGAAVAVLVAESIPRFATPPSVLVDARMAKQPLDTTRDQAPMVVGLGPGFAAGDHCHAVIETNRGPNLGAVIWEGSAETDTGVPGVLGGESERRVLRADSHGAIEWDIAIGDLVTAGDRVGQVGSEPLTAPIGGVVRGLIGEGPVKAGLKVGDIDPRGDPAAAFEISDKSRAVAGGVLEAVMTWLNQP